MITKFLGIGLLIVALFQFIITGTLVLLQEQIDSEILDPGNPYAFGAWIALIIGGLVALWQHNKSNNKHTLAQNDQLIKELIDSMRHQTEAFATAQKETSDKLLEMEKIRTKGIEAIADAVNGIIKNK